MYQATYKCRLCGEVFYNFKSVDNIGCACTIAGCFCSKSNVDNASISYRCKHICEENSVGLADFIGFKNVGDELNG